jgi:hypothetical protein
MSTTLSSQTKIEGVEGKDLADGWVEIDGKYYKKEIMALGIIDAISAVMNVVSNVTATNDELISEKAEKVNIRNNKKSTNQLTWLRKKWEKDELTFFEYMNRRAHLLNIPINDLYEAEIVLNSKSKIRQYRNQIK